MTRDPSNSAPAEDHVLDFDVSDDALEAVAFAAPKYTEFTVPPICCAPGIISHRSVARAPAGTRLRTAE